MTILPESSNNLVQNSFARFFIASAIGASVDILFGNLCLLAEIHIYFALCVGFLLGLFTTFFLHMRWTFVCAKKTNCAAVLFVKFFFSSLFILLVRFAVVYLCGCLLPRSIFFQSATLVAAVGISFCLNYIIQKRLVFAQSARSK